MCIRDSCDQDADCSCDGHGGDAYEHDWRTPKCPEGYYECGDCCDRDADCACDDQCERFRAPSCFRRERWKGERQYRPCNSDLPANVDCSLAYHENASKPHGWCPVGYHDCGQHDCCDWNGDCACDGAWRTGNLDEHCGPGPTGRDGALWGFECSGRRCRGGDGSGGSRSGGGGSGAVAKPHCPHRRAVPSGLGAARRRAGGEADDGCAGLGPRCLRTVGKMLRIADQCGILRLYKACI